MSGLVIAHRGDSHRAPENTLPALELAIDAGADWVELDIQATRDGRLILFQDLTLARVSSSVRRVRKTPYERLARVDVGLHKSPKFRGTTIPLLEEALAVAAGRVGLLLDVKRPGGNLDLFGHELVRCVRDSGCQVVIQSLNADYLRRLKQRYGEFPTSLLARRRMGALKRARSAGVDILHIYFRAASRRLVGAAHQAGLQVFAYTVKTPGRALRLAAKGVDGMTTSDPARIRRALSSRK